MAISPTLNRISPVSRESISPTTAPPERPDAATPLVQTQATQQNRAPKAQSFSVSPETSHRTTIDQSTGDLVYHVIDTRSGQQVAQSPDEAMLRMRAYTKQMDVSKLTKL
jgi:uncharacterized FlaG/YvyC family protein